MQAASLAYVLAQIEQLANNVDRPRLVTQAKRIGEGQDAARKKRAKTAETRKKEIQDQARELWASNPRLSVNRVAQLIIKTRADNKMPTRGFGKRTVIDAIKCPDQYLS